VAKLRKDIFLIAKAFNTDSASWQPAAGVLGLGVTKFYPGYFEPLSEIYFEATWEHIAGEGINGPEITKVRLYDKTNSVQIVEISVTNDPGFHRVRSGNLMGTLGTGNRELYVQISRSGGSVPSTSLYTARLIVIQNGTIIKTATYWQVGDDDMTVSAGPIEVSDPARMWNDFDNYDGTLDFFFQTTHAMEVGATNSTITLYDMDNTANIGSVRTSSLSFVFGEDLTVSPNNNARHTVRMQSTGGPFFGSSIKIAHYVITQDGEGTPLTKTECPIQVTKSTFLGSSTSYSPANRKWCGYDPADYVDVTIPSGSAEYTMKVTGGTGYVKLIKDTTDIANSEVTTTSATHERVTGVDITLPTSETDVSADAKVSAGGNTVSISSMRILLYLIEIQPVDTPMLLNIGDAWKSVDSMKINIDDVWKDVVGAQINIGDAWKTIF